MTIAVMPGLTVSAYDLARLESYMSDKGGDWRVHEADGNSSTYFLMSELPVTDDGLHVGVGVQLDTEPLFDLNRELEIASQGQRFGDGRVVGKIPMHLLYADEAGNIGRALDEGDRKHVRRILNDSEYSKFRSFRGKL